MDCLIILAINFFNTQTGGALSLVTRIMGRGTMEIQCDNNVTVRGVLSGRMKKNRIKVIQGDRVKVSVSPYDTSHGLVTYRFK